PRRHERRAVLRGARELESPGRSLADRSPGLREIEIVVQGVGLVVVVRRAFDPVRRARVRADLPTHCPARLADRAQGAAALPEGMLLQAAGRARHHRPDTTLAAPAHALQVAPEDRAHTAHLLVEPGARHSLLSERRRRRPRPEAESLARDEQQAAWKSE